MTKTSERACEPTLIVTNYQVTNVCSSCGFWSNLKLVCPVWGPDPCWGCNRKTIYILCLPIHQWFSSSATGVIAAGGAVSWTPGVARIRHIRRRTASWGTLGITRKVTRSRARYAGWCGGRRDRACSIRSLHKIRTAVVIAFWKTAVVACPRARWKYGCRMRARMKSAARRSTAWWEAWIWSGAWLCAYAVAFWLQKPVGSQVTCRKGN